MPLELRADSSLNSNHMTQHWVLEHWTTMVLMCTVVLSNLTKKGLRNCSKLETNATAPSWSPFHLEIYQELLPHLILRESQKSHYNDEHVCATHWISGSLKDSGHHPKPERMEVKLMHSEVMPCNISALPLSPGWDTHKPRVPTHVLRASYSDFL